MTSFKSILLITHYFLVLFLSAATSFLPLGVS